MGVPELLHSFVGPPNLGLDPDPSLWTLKEEVTQFIEGP
jgi:hypothetical protein